MKKCEIFNLIHTILKFLISIIVSSANSEEINLFISSQLAKRILSFTNSNNHLQNGKMQFFLKKSPQLTENKN